MRSVRVSGLAEDPVEVRAAYRADGLRHPGALVVDADLAARLALGLALHAVELAAPGLRHDGLLALLILGRRDGGSGEARRDRVTWSTRSSSTLRHPARGVRAAHR